MVSKSVLLCEDRPDVREVLCIGLRSMGIHVVDFASADEALASSVWNFVDFDAVVTDYDMPGTDGKKFAEHVRGVNPTIPIVVISGMINFSLNDQALDIQYLKKPFATSRLLQLLFDRTTRSVDLNPQCESSLK